MQPTSKLTNFKQLLILGKLPRDMSLQVAAYLAPWSWVPWAKTKDWAWRPRQTSQRMFGQKLSEFNVLNIISPLAQTHILEYVIRCLTSEQLHSLDARRGAKLFTFDISKIGATAWGSQAAKSNGPMANDSNVFCHEPLLTPYSLGFLGGWVRPSADVESRWAHYASSFPGPTGPVQ
jgi:hypothetical protein